MRLFILLIIVVQGITLLAEDEFPADGNLHDFKLDEPQTIRIVNPFGDIDVHFTKDKENSSLFIPKRDVGNPSVSIKRYPGNRLEIIVLGHQNANCPLDLLIPREYVKDLKAISPHGNITFYSWLPADDIPHRLEAVSKTGEIAISEMSGTSFFFKKNGSEKDLEKAAEHARKGLDMSKTDLSSAESINEKIAQTRKEADAISAHLFGSELQTTVVASTQSGKIEVLGGYNTNFRLQSETGEITGHLIHRNDFAIRTGGNSRLTLLDESTSVRFDGDEDRLHIIQKNGANVSFGKISCEISADQLSNSRFAFGSGIHGDAGIIK